ncbi:MAG TPA: hypothetical protein DEQ47_00230 [Solibacterales bacterium]|nr:hypothetical protein [Bryobacterales bacterium]
MGLIAAGSAFGQVLSPPEIRDPRLRELQQKHLPDLERVAAEIAAHSFPYRLYFSRTLDLNEDQQRRSDQRSIRFDTFHDQTVLEITANYYASYSAELMPREERASRTLADVITPMLKAAIPALANEVKVQSFAVEISHHVRRKVLGVSHESPENIAFVLSSRGARQLMAATTPGEQEAALMQGQLFVNRQLIAGWGENDLSSTAERSATLAAAKVAGPWNGTLPPALGEMRRAAVTALPTKTPARVATQAHPEISSDALRSLQGAHQADLDRLVRELDQQAHFIAYAAPTFIAFRNGVYLQLSMKTMLSEAATVSQYQAAALAFDEHIAHLIRPVLAALKGRPDFDGIDFSTSVRVAGAPEGSGTAVEFIFTADNLSNYRNFDLTGQELIKTGVVLINGERVGLELQYAEDGLARPH